MTRQQGIRGGIGDTINHRDVRPKTEIRCGVQKCGAKKDTSTARARQTLESIDLGADGDRVKKEHWETYRIFLRSYCQKTNLMHTSFVVAIVGVSRSLFGLIGFGASLNSINFYFRALSSVGQNTCLISSMSAVRGCEGSPTLNIIAVCYI